MIKNEQPAITTIQLIAKGIWVCPDCNCLNAIDNKRCVRCNCEKFFTVTYLPGKF